MYYYGYFRDTDTSTDSLGNLYKVVIITNFTKSEFTVGGELQLSSSPFTTSWTGEEDNLFKGYKCSTATVGFYQETYNFEFNNTRENNVFVALLKLKKGKNKSDDKGMSTDSSLYDVVWTGYATPNAYSQSYSSSLDLFELECQDALSTLKYKNFSGDIQVGNGYSKFSKTLIKYIGGLGNYKNIYISSSLVLPTEDLGSIVEFIYVNDSNFYDEDNKPEKAMDVLNEICVYLGLTMIPWGDSVFLLDYHSLEMGDYYRIYSKKDGSYGLLADKNSDNWDYDDAPMSFHHFRDIQKEDFSGSDTTLSLGSTYNKVNVISDIYGMDSIICDFEKKENYTDSIVLDEPDTSYGSAVVNKVTALGTEINGTYSDDGTKYCKAIYKFKNINNSEAKLGNLLNTITTRWYNKDTSIAGDGTLIGLYGNANTQNATYANLRNYIGATFVEYCSGSVSSLDESLTGSKKKAIIMGLHNSKLNEDAQQLALQYQSGRKVLENTGGHTWREQDTIRQIMFTVNTKKVLLSSTDYIVLKGNMTFYGADSLFIPYATSNQTTSTIPCFVWCSLSDDFGNYWNGTKWCKRSDFSYTIKINNVTETKLKEPVFKLPLKYIKGNGFGTKVPFVSYLNLNVTSENEGYIVPPPPSAEDVIPTTINFSMYKPHGLCYHVDTDMAILEDFDLTISGKNDDNVVNSEDNTNTSYTNTLNSEAIEEYPDIEFKITSWDNKQVNKSSTYWLKYSGKNWPSSTNPITAGYSFSRVSALFNKSTGQVAAPEELAVHNYSKQYSTPTASLQLSLFNSLGIAPYSLLEYHFLPSRTFVVDGMSIDYEYNSVKLTLIERK